MNHTFPIIVPNFLFYVLVSKSSGVIFDGGQRVFGPCVIFHV